MDKIKEFMLGKEAEIKTIIQKKQADLQDAPEGYVRVTRHKNTPQYYHIKENAVTNGEYIKTSNKELAFRLAQKSYDMKILKNAEKQLIAIKRFNTSYPDESLTEIYEKLATDRQSLITPVSLPDKQYADKWQSSEYEGKSIEGLSTEYYTDKGERVRSKSEILIANTLTGLGIPYRYEAPLKLKGLGTIYPDFTVLNVKDRCEMYWEHLGMMDNPEYLTNALYRLQVYEKNGYFPGDKLILTFETSEMPLGTKLLKEIAAHYFL